MRTRSRLALLTAAGILALVLSAPAFASYVPTLAISHFPPALGSTGTTDIDVIVGVNDDATAKAQIFVPKGYGANLSAAAGTQIGDVFAVVKAGALGGVLLTLPGQILADNPANYATPATQCTGVPTHTAVWVLVLTASGQTLRVPLYVDPAADAAAAFASYTIQVCLPSPDVPPEQGGATFGAKLVAATLLLDGIYTTPSSAFASAAASDPRFVWTSTFTPYVAGTATPNPTATVEARGVVPLPSRLTLKGKYNKKKKRATLSGAANEGGAPGAGVTVRLYQGKTARAAGNATKAFATARTGSSGAYAKSTRITRTTFFQAVLFPRDVTAAGCAGTSIAPAGCVSAWIGGLLSPIIKVTVPKRR